MFRSPETLDETTVSDGGGFVSCPAVAAVFVRTFLIR